MIDWNQGSGFDHFRTDGPQAPWWTIFPNYGPKGWFDLYPFFITIGMILAVGYSAWKFYRKGMSITDLAIGVVFIVPIALFWASFFGKINGGPNGIGNAPVGKDHHAASFWECFEFWEAGMSIHGGVLGGIITGIIVFGIIGHFRKVSMWTYADAILPNVFLGQAVGRWGNFFNHELTGAPLAVVGKYDLDAAAGVVHYIQPINDSGVLKWLPEYIKTNTQLVYDGNGMTIDTFGGPLTLTRGDIVQMNPIFFYEFIAFIILWFLITFVVPNFGKWFGPKPWKKMKSNFKLDWKQTFINIFEFWKVPSYSKMENETIKIYSKGEVPSYNNQPAWAQSWFSIWKQAYEYNPNINEKKEYEMRISEIENSNYSADKKRKQSGKELLKANNPEGYWITKVGFEASAYLFTWNIVRFALEIQRATDLLFIMNDKTLSLALIAATGFIGLLGMIFTQTLFPIYFRQPGILYEKDFFKAKKINKHWGK